METRQELLVALHVMDQMGLKPVKCLDQLIEMEPLPSSGE
jgi:hypothetical protein